MLLHSSDDLFLHHAHLVVPLQAQGLDEDVNHDSRRAVEDGHNPRLDVVAMPATPRHATPCVEVTHTISEIMPSDPRNFQVGMLSEIVCISSMLAIGADAMTPTPESPPSHKFHQQITCKHTRYR